MNADPEIYDTKANLAIKGNIELFNFLEIETSMIHNLLQI